MDCLLGHGIVGSVENQFIRMSLWLSEVQFKMSNRTDGRKIRLFYHVVSDPSLNVAMLLWIC